MKKEVLKKKYWCKEVKVRKSGHSHLENLFNSTLDLALERNWKVESINYFENNKLYFKDDEPEIGYQIVFSKRTIKQYNGVLGKFIYDIEEYTINQDGYIIYIGEYTKPSYLNGLTNYSYMFMDRNDLEYLDLSNWDTSNVLSMKGMFYGCNFLKHISGLDKWNTSSLQSSNHMFYQCSSLSDINDLRNWDMSNVKNYVDMFFGCNSILDASVLDEWEMYDYPRIFKMFDNCKEDLIIPKWYHLTRSNNKDLKGLYLENSESIPFIPLTTVLNVENYK